jgi:putative heme-binding domain-containing protein
VTGWPIGARSGSQGQTLTGCANDLHGPYLGPDGWIYWTKGAFAEQTYERAGRRAPLVTRAAHIFRRRPGDTVVEAVLTGGMDNPVDVAFTAGGERILTATFVEHPQLGRRDALLHAIYGGVYGKPHAVVDGHPQTGDLMPALAHLGPAVPAGLTRYASRAFGDGYRDTFFAALFNLHTVAHVRLTPESATYRADVSDFLVSSSRDFHPTDVVEDADGSLLVIDTGPWYKLCCPTSQLAKPDLPGAIYRVRRANVRVPRDPRGARVPWPTLDAADLTALFDDPRPAVRQRAVQEAGGRGLDALPSLARVFHTFRTADARLSAVWALARIEAPEARDVIRTALADPSPQVRHAAAHVAGLWRDRAAAPLLVGLLESGTPPLQRVAAEALGRIGDPGSVSAIMARADAEGDRVLEHSLTYALIEIGDATGIRAAGRSAASSRGRRAALVALDQMHGSTLEPADVLPLLESADPLLHDTAWWIAGRRPAWGDALAAAVSSQLDAGGGAERAERLAARLSPLAGAPAIQAVLASAVAAGTTHARRTALAAMAAGRMRTLPPPWVSPLVAVLDSDEEEDVRLAVDVIRALPPSADQAAATGSALMQLARDDRRPVDLRLAALASIRGRLPQPDAVVFDMLQASLRPSEPALLRSRAAAIVERADLDRGQLLALAGMVEQAGPLELPRLLPAFDQTSEEAVGLALVTALERAPGRQSLRADDLRARLAGYPAAVRARGDALLASSATDASRQAQRLDALLADLPAGDVRRGQAVFNSDKAACLSCHAVGYLGGTIGPDLTRIGEVRSARDLLEAVVFPGASFARGYEPVLVTTRGGAVQGGILASDGADEIVLVSAVGAEVRVARADIVDIQPDRVSLMPDGYDTLLTPQELADLVAFLQATRWGVN